MSGEKRRLAGILAADIVGYSAMVAADESATLARVRALRDEIVTPAAATHHGRLFKTMGDGFLLEFASAVQALRCAIAIQTTLNAQTDGLRLRVGVHQGEVMPEGDDLFGDGVIIAARLEPLAEHGGIVISSRVKEDASGKMTLEVDDLGEPELKNITLKIRAYRVRLAGPAWAPAEPVLALPDKPSIAVLPFKNMSDDPAQEHVGDGIVEEIIAALSRFRSFFVISRNSAFTYKDRAVDARQVGRELGVRYIVEGSIRKSGARLRIMAQLIDATTGNHVWSERYDGNTSDVFDLQDRVTQAVVGAIEPSITVSEIERARRKRPENLGAYDYVMRALPAIWSQDSETTDEGLRLAERAIALDPGYALPKAVAAWCYAQRLSYLRTKNFTEDRSKAITLARDAARLDGNDPLVLTCAGAAYSITREFSLAQTLIQKALTLDPNSAWAWHRSGWINVYVRQPETAFEHFRRALRLSPVDPLTFNLFIGMGLAHFEKEEYDEAVTWIEKGLREKPDAYWVNRVLSAAYFHAGRSEDARQTFASFCEHFPDMTVQKVLERTPGSDWVRQKFETAFRVLGLPE